MNPNRVKGIISVDLVRELQARGIEFRCRYDLLDYDRTDTPRYLCVYLLENGSEETLITTRVGKGGGKNRRFSLWPGLFKHHEEYGDGSHLIVHPDYRISTVRVDENGITPLTGPLADGETFPDPDA